MVDDVIRVDVGEIRTQVGLTENSVANVEPETLEPDTYSKVIQLENLLELHERLSGLTRTLTSVIRYDLDRIVGSAAAIEAQDRELAATFVER